MGGMAGLLEGTAVFMRGELPGLCLGCDATDKLLTKEVLQQTSQI